jgi:pyroglutamyl-peptidase
MQPPPVRALITGFGPFPGIIANASAAFAPLLAEHINAMSGPVQAMPAVLPTEWDAAPRLLARLVDEVQPHVSLHFGVSGTAQGLVLETIAHNTTSERPDVAGLVPASRSLIDSAPDVLTAATDPRRLIARTLRVGSPLEASVNAGTYVCNALYFHALWLARREVLTGQRRRLVSFVHLPVRVGEAGLAADPEQVVHRISLPDALNSALGLLEALVEQYHERPLRAGMELATGA